ncbi:hypothetical protein Tcan_04657 [Toxocara canis]|uniref:BED-type domain-containing protein n=1 Tax=Toxocara canis TaxID=6265 RepID=A0A0B2VT32_TOXCA|nr:hypothetical protein Tcan_04657 [Toxocara canis]
MVDESERSERCETSAVQYHLNLLVKNRIEEKRKMNGTLMSTNQMLNSISQLLNYSKAVNQKDGESSKKVFTTSMKEEQNADEPMPSTSAADSQTAASSLSKYLRPGDSGNDAVQSDNSGEHQQPSRRRLRRERVHPVSAYFLVTDEKSKCAICILCFNVMKASKTANLMRHMSRYHKLVAADLEKQWDIIKGSKLKYRPRDDFALASLPIASDVMPASPLNNESSSNGSPFLGLEHNVADGAMSITGSESKGVLRAEDLLEESIACESTPSFVQATLQVRIQESTDKEKCENYDAHIQEATGEMAHAEEADSGASTSGLSSCPSCVKRTADRALLVTLLKKQDQLLKNTERLLEENAEREKLFQEKQEEFWKRASALIKAQEEQHQRFISARVSIQTLRGIATVFIGGGLVILCCNLRIEVSKLIALNGTILDRTWQGSIRNSQHHNLPTTSLSFTVKDCSSACATVQRDGSVLKNMGRNENEENDYDRLKSMKHKLSIVSEKDENDLDSGEAKILYSTNGLPSLKEENITVTLRAGKCSRDTTLPTQAEKDVKSPEQQLRSPAGGTLTAFEEIQIMNMVHPGNGSSDKIPSTPPADFQYCDRLPRKWDEMEVLPNSDSAARLAEIISTRSDEAETANDLFHITPEVQDLTSRRNTCPSRERPVEKSSAKFEYEEESTKEGL